MKAGEQLSAMEMMAVDPVSRILAPRFWGAVIAMPLLAAVFSAVGVVGGWAVCVPMIGIDSGSFWSQMQSGVDVWVDVGNGDKVFVAFALDCCDRKAFAYVARTEPLSAADIEDLMVKAVEARFGESLRCPREIQWHGRSVRKNNQAGLRSTRSPSTFNRVLKIGVHTTFSYYCIFNCGL
jgi:hypothetical protein